MKISVIIPVAPQYAHAEKYLNRCLASVVWQLKADDEIVIEGAGENVVHDNFGWDPWIRFLPLEPNRGISASRNRAVRESRGDWIKFLDCDDLLAPFALDMFRAIAIPSSVQMVTGPQIKVINSQVLGGGHALPDMRTIKQLNPTLPSMSLVRRAAFDAVGGFDEQIHFEEDWDLWLKLEQKFGLPGFGVVKFPVCYYWIDEAERKTKTAEHTVAMGGERVDVREYFKRKYGCEPI